MDRQALPRVLVDQVQESNRPSIMGVCTHEVIGPDVIAMLRPQPHAGAVVRSQTVAWLAIGCVLPFATATSICANVHNPLRRMLPCVAYFMLLLYQSVSLHLVRNLP